MGKRKKKRKKNATGTLKALQCVVKDNHQEQRTVRCSVSKQVRGLLL